MRSGDHVHALGCLPLVRPEQLIGQRELLVVAPHPDDESIGCGGLLAWAAASGNRPRVLFVTDGERSHPGSLLFPPAMLARVRRGEAVQACAALGVKADAVTFLSAPDSGLAGLADTLTDELVRAIGNWVNMSQRPVVCIPAQSDPHSDHVATHHMVKDAVRHMDVSLFAYPVWTWLVPDALGELLAGRRVDVSHYGGAKSAAIAAHASQHGKIVRDAIEPFVLPASLLHFAGLPFEVLLDVAL